MKAFEWLSLDIKSIDFEKDYESLKEAVLRDTGLNGQISIKNKDDLIKVIRAFKKVRLVQLERDEYFISEKHKLAYCILKHERGFFDKELGITKKHYIDKEEAKRWRNKFIKIFHSDRDTDNTFVSNEEVTAKINKIYNQMVGKS